MCLALRILSNYPLGYFSPSVIDYDELFKVSRFFETIISDVSCYHAVSLISSEETWFYPDLFRDLSFSPVLQVTAVHFSGSIVRF